MTQAKPTGFIQIQTKDLHPHPKNVKIYGSEDVSDLAAAIKESGWIKPLVVTSDFVIVSGHRRREAALSLDIQDVPCEIIDFDSELDVLARLLAENEYREKTVVQRTREYKMRKEIEQARAKERLGGRHKQESTTDNCPELEEGEARDKAAKESGMGSGRRAEDAVKALDVADRLKDEGQKEKSALLEQAIEKSKSGAFELTKFIDSLSREDAAKFADRLRKGSISVSQVKTQIARAEKERKPAHVSHNSGNNEWYTPSQYIEAARKAMGSIDLDPASSAFANKTVKADRFYSVDDDGLTLEWFGNVWLNPPYSQPEISQFIEKLTVENYRQAIVLVNNATETKWGNLLITISSAVCFHRGRIRYLNHTGKPANTPLQGQVFAYIGDNPDQFIKCFKGFGVCLKGLS